MKTPNIEQVKELENAVIELLGTHEDCSHFSSTIQSVGEKYQPGPQVLGIFFFMHVSHSMTLLILVPISTYLYICYFCNPSKLMCVYYLRSQLTDFDQLFKNEVAMLKANSSSDPQNHPLMRQFREAVWV